MNRKIVSYIILGVVSVSSLRGEFESKVGTTVATFLKIGQSPRAMGVGDAYVALGDDAASVFWNPAGILSLSGRTFHASYLDWLSDLRFTSFVASFPIDNTSSVALSAISLGMNDIDVTTVQNPDGDGTKVGAGDIALGLSYARELSESFSVAITTKLINSSIARETATGLAADIGTIYEPGWGNLKVGMCLSNLGTKMKLDGRDLDVKYDTDPVLGSDEPTEARLRTNSWDLPTTFRLGLASDIVNSKTVKVSLALDGIHASDTKERLAFGTEVTLLDMLTVRVGTGLNYDQARLAGGIGLKFPNVSGLTVDYSFLTVEPFGIVQAVGVNFANW